MLITIFLCHDPLHADHPAEHGIYVVVVVAARANSGAGLLRAVSFLLLTATETGEARKRADILSRPGLPATGIFKGIFMR